MSDGDYGIVDEGCSGGNVFHDGFRGDMGRVVHITFSHCGSVHITTMVVEDDNFMVTKVTLMVVEAGGRGCVGRLWWSAVPLTVVTVEGSCACDCGACGLWREAVALAGVHSCCGRLWWAVEPLNPHSSKEARMESHRPPGDAPNDAGSARRVR